MLFREVVPLDGRAWTDCADCGVLGDFYMIHSHVGPVADDFGWLCIPCLEVRGPQALEGDTVAAETGGADAPRTSDRRFD